MLTRLRVQGFKNLLDADLSFGPFTCVAGLNGAGKSNLFDAIHFLHLLADHPIMEAVRLLREARGRTPHPRALFSVFGDFRAPEIRFTADLVIDRETEDDFGVAAQAAISTVRYTVAFRLNEDEKTQRLELAEESLVPISLANARKSIAFPRSSQFVDSIVQGRRTVPFLSTHVEGDQVRIRVHQEGHGGRTVSAPRSSRTVLGGLASSDYPTLLAVHREVQSWQTLLLEPSAMRAPSFYSDPRHIDDRGANIPAAIERLRRAENRNGQTCARIANRLADLVDDVRALRIEDDERSETLTLEVEVGDDIFHAARSLSDGTLRFIVLATLLFDPETTGLICLEEPENGIHPTRIPQMIELLRDIACDAGYAVDENNPLQQVIVNTHSPVVVDNISVDDLVFVENEMVLRNGSQGRSAEFLVPWNSWRAKRADPSLHLSPGLMQPYFRFNGTLPEQLSLNFSS